MKESPELLQNIKVIMSTLSVSNNSKSHMNIKPWISFYKRILFRAMSKDFLLPHDFPESY